MNEWMTWMNEIDVQRAFVLYLMLMIVKPTTAKHMIENGKVGEQNTTTFEKHFQRQ